tara:strand:+ start:13638 stop:15530 length:1893 start_codon:yes stop_codon:yes gene_type:complete
MLQSIRDKAQGWIAWAIVILLSIPFALFGIEEYLGGGNEEIVAEIDGTEISENMLKRKISNFRESMRQNLGENYEQSFFEGKNFELQILNQLINETVVDKIVRDWNLRADDSQVSSYIRNAESFQNQGAFDKQLYESALRSRGLSSSGFEDFVRQDIVISQFENGIKSTNFIPKKEILNYVRLMNQKRYIEYIRIPKSNFYSTSKVNDNDAQAFYDTEIDKYVTPERVKIEYIELNLDSLSEFVEINEDDLLNHFFQNKVEFVGNSEREVSHILIGESFKTDAERLQKIDSISLQLKNGEKFSVLAEKFSDDPGSAKDGGKLGWLSRGIMPKEFENKAFSIEVGSLSDPIKTEFGYHVIWVTNERGNSKLDYNDVKEKVLKSFITLQSEDLYYDYFERFSTAAYEDSTSLESASQVVNAPIKRTDWLTKSGGFPENLSKQKIINSIFSEDVLINRNNSEVIELSPTEAVVLRVTDHEKADRLPFEDVKDSVIAEVAEVLASSEAEEQGKLLLKLAEEGTSLGSIAKRNGYKLEENVVSRFQEKIPSDLLKKTFEQSRPSLKNPIVFGMTLESGDFYLVSLKKIEDEVNEELSISDLAIIQDNFLKNLGDYEMGELLKNKRSQLSVEVKGR